MAGRIKRETVKVCPCCGGRLTVELSGVICYGVNPETGRVSKRPEITTEEGPFVYCQKTTKTLPDLMVYKGRIVRETVVRPPTVDEMVGIAPDITGGLPADEHVRRLRDEEVSPQ